MPLFVRLTLAITALIVAAVVFLMVLKIVVIAAIVAAVTIGGVYTVRFLRARGIGRIGVRRPMVRRM